MGKLALCCPTSQALGNISPSTSAAIWRNISFLPAVAAGGDTQQGSPFTPHLGAPHHLSGARGTCVGILVSQAQPMAQPLASQLCSHSLDPPSPAPARWAVVLPLSVALSAFVC